MLSFGKVNRFVSAGTLGKERLERLDVVAGSVDRNVVYTVAVQEVAK